MTLWRSGPMTESDGLMERFHDSIGFDHRLHASDIRGSMAYAGALEAAGLIAAHEREELVDGLRKVMSEFESGSFEVKPGDEDIHTAVERRLGELIGAVAGKLHTGRSRNDQVATDMRLYMLHEIASLESELAKLQTAVVTKAEAHLGVIMPGYTHMQQAQPVLFSHWLMSHFWRFQRDRERLGDVAKRTAVLPLGAGALAGHPLGIDRAALAAGLGFEAIAQNSLDAVSDRDFVVELLAWAALVQVHLSALAEDLIIWSSREFGFVRLAEAYSTGSSLMPQKRNPDSLELIRGKSGRITGHLVGLLTALKGLPSAYNKDLQEDKEAVFDVIDTLAMELPVASGVICTLHVNAGRMASAMDDQMLATDLADYLVRKGVPFRQSHHLVSEAVARAHAVGCTLKDLDLAEYAAIHSAFEADLYQVLDYQRSVTARDAEGGTAPAAVLSQIDRARTLLASGTQV